MVAGQIHATSDDLMQIRLEGRRLVVKYADGKEEQLLDPDYKMGTPFDVDITAANGTVQVAYNGEQKPALKIAGIGFYFKAGAYTQSNPEKGDRPDSAGRVVIYRLDVQHSDPGGTTSAPGAERERNHQ